MNIESKARAGFTSIMLRGGRMTKWKGQVASYAPHVGHLQNVSVAAIAAALAFGGSVALPSEALAQDVTVTVTDPQVPVDETNNGNGSLIINAPNGVTGGTTEAGIKATNISPNADNITIDALSASGTSGMVVVNNGTGLTSITAGKITGSTVDGVNVKTSGSGVTIIANEISAGNVGVLVDNQGTGNVVVDVANFVTANDGNIAEITVGENGGSIDLSFGSAFGNDEGIFVDSDSTDGGIAIAVNGNLVVEGNEAFQGTGIDASIDSGTNTGNLTVTTGNVSAINAVDVANAGQGFINVQSVGQLLGAGGFGVNAQQTGEGKGITINADSIIANDSGVTVGMTNGNGVINVTADSIFAVNVSSDPNATNLFNLDANGQFIADQTQVGVSIDAGSADAGNIDVSVTDITAGTGIDIDNSGTGSVTITDFDQILALAGQGISVTQDGAGGQGITINGQTIESQTTGVNILASFGQGDIDVDVDSIEVEDGLSSGVSIVASSTGAGNILVNVPDITAGSGIDIINSGEGYALVESFGQILASSGNGISVTQNGAGEGVTINANVIDAASDGIAASLTSGNGGVSISAVDVKAGSNGISTYNNSGGASTILVGGSIDAGDNAINAVNGANASDLTITGTDVAATITGGASGIYARNNGTGVTLVSVAGAVTGTAGIGIDVQNGGDAKGISISAADVDGRVRGINAVNDGKGNIDISVSGTVNSLLGQGINADNGASGSSLSIKANVINAATSGIIANNDGNYDTSVTTYGAVDAAAGDGIKVTNGATARNLTVDARADVTGGTDGIDVVNNGVGSSEVNVAANVTGKAGNAISVVNNGATKGLTITANNATATIDGDGFGIYAQNSGGGDTTISVAGTVTADRFDGISAFNGGTAGSISISAGDVTGNYNGIAARNYGTGTTTIAVSGTVTGGAGYNGIFAYNGEYTSGTAASATNAGTGLTITSTKVSDIVNGVAVPTISGDNHGIYAKNLGAGATTLSVAGAIKAASGDGIFVENGANSLGVSINVASVSGGDDGIFALNNGANDTVISATDVDGKSGIGIYAKNAATANSISVSALGITALTDGVKVQNDGTGSVTIAVTNTIAAGQDGVDAVNNGAGNLTIFANSIVAGEEGIEAVNTGADLEIEAASILADRNAVLATNNGTGNTTLTLNGDVTGGAGYNAIEATNATTAGDLTINSTAPAVADANGVIPATIKGGANGILAVNNSNKGGSTTITVAGKVVGTTADGINAANGQGSFGLTIDAANVEGAEFGVLASNAGTGSTLVKSTGVVTGGTGAGVSVSNTNAALNLAVDVAEVTGGTFGVVANNQGRGTTNVTVSQLAKGNSIDGIRVTNGTLASDLNVTANDVEGARRGVYATNDGTGNTTLTLSGTVTGGAGFNAIEATNATTAGDLTINSTAPAVADANGVIPATIKGGANGILAVNNSNKGGSTTITVAGKVVGTTADGINAANGQGSFGLTIDAANVEGAEFGVLASNAGTGSTLVKSTGVVTGGTGAGVSVSNTNAALNLAVDVAEVTGGTFGVVANNQGRGTTNVTVSQLAKGNSIDGIRVTNGTLASDLNVTANDVEGARRGVYATNDGTGNTTLTLSGTVTGGAGFNAIEATNATTAGDLTINSTAPAVADANGVIPATIKGGANGILAVNNSNKGGSTTITVAGKVVGTTADGINAANGQGSFGLTIDAANVEGAEFGVLASNAGTGSTLVKSTGVVTGGTGAGVSVSNTNAALNLAVDVAEVTGGTFGVVANNQGRGATNVTVSQLAKGNSIDGIRVTNGTLASDLNVTAKNVEGARRGVYATNDGTGNTTLTLSGTVTGGAGYNAIEATNATTAGDLTINSTAPAVADANGVIPATIKGGANGILAVNNSNKGGSTTITVAGKVVGTTADGIRAENAAGSATANLTVLAHDVQAEQYGIIALNFGTGATTVVSTGTATGLNEDGIFVYSGGAGDITVQAVNASGKDGIDVSNYGQGSSSKITVTGDVVGNEAFGFFASNGTYNGKSAYNLTAEVNNVTGKIDAIHLFNEGTGSIDLTVNGTVISETENGIYARVDTSAKNLKVTGTNAAATITGNDTGVYLLNNGTGSTSINIAGTIKGLTGDGVSVDSNVNTTGLSVNVAAVTGNDYGINVDQSGSGSTTIIATGDVVGENRSGIFADLGQATNDLTVEVRNGANVRGGEFGVGLYNYGVGSTILRTTGAVVGEAEDGIFVVNGPTALNLTVEANNVQGVSNGIVANNQGTGFTLVSASGTVTGGRIGDGINVTHTGAGQNLTITATKLAVADANGVVAPTVSGGVNGIIAVNNGTSNGATGSSTTVTALGKTVGATGAGISVTNNAGAADLAITANEVEGATTGIFAANNGTGNNSVAVTGNVTGGTGFNAVDVTNAATAKDLTITGTNAAATITGDVNGILASNQGTGSTSIAVAGKVVGTTGDGINADNAQSTQNLVIAAGEVSGAIDGIDAFNYGVGETRVTATGTVTGTGGDGIRVTAQNQDGAGIFVQAVSVTGGANAIKATNRGNGSTTVIATGDVVSTGAVANVVNDGIYATNRNAGSVDLLITAVNVTGVDRGIRADNAGGSGSTTVTATGTVKGVNDIGISASNGAQAVNLIVHANNVEGQYGITASNKGSGYTRVIADGNVKGLIGAGIYANNAATGTDITVTAKDVTGFKNAIDVSNYGKGNSAVSVSGNVTGGAGFNAIEAVNATSAKDLVITAANAGATITGGLNGVLATNEGVGGSTAVNIAGSVIGLGNDGIQVENKAGTNGLTLTANNVSGAENGIVAKNGGTGETIVTAIGDVVGTRGTGIDVSNNALATNIVVNTAKVTGGAVGIAAINSGSGFTRVTATGDINGNDAGIFAANGGNATDLSVAAANVSSTEVGIFVDNAGKGTTSVTLAGNVTGGTGFNAVDVRNGVAAKDLTITAGNAAGKIAGGLNGLNVLNNGKDASTSVSLAGSVAGTVDDGVHVESGADTLNVSVTVKDANGGDEAVEVINRGKGSTTVVASGAVVGRDNGLVAANTATGTTLSVTAKDVTGAVSGISTNSLGTGATTISVSGKIAGGTGVGISASNAAGTTATINLAATADVSATSGNAILNNGGNSVLNVANGAGLRGTVRLGDGSDTANFALASTEAFIGITALDGGDNVSAADGFVDTLNLNGVGNYDLVGARVTNWEAININAGTVGFSDAIITAGALNVANGTTLNGGNSLVATANVTVAANGTLQAGNAAGNSRTRIVGNLASAGLVNLSGPAGSAKAGDTLAVTGNFTGNGGQVRLDTVLGGDNSPTDLVSITGNAVGGSLLAINNTGGLGGLTTGDGIRVVQVGGTSDRDAFALLGDDLQAGGFRYDLFLGGIADPKDQDWYLRTVGASDIAATTLSFARLSDDIAMTFLGTLHERVGEQEHLAKRGYQSAGTGGLWGRFVGKGFRERLSSATLGDIKSTGSISGLQMGLDFGRSIKSDGSATFTGAYAGYADGSSNDQNIFRNVARRSGSSDSKGWLTGLYATHYGSTGWYANAVVQATWVDASASARNGVTLETDGRTYLGSVELGKSLKLGNRLAFETQAQLIYGETRFDDARDSAGIANKIRIEDSLTGRVGFRLKTTKDEKYNAAGGLFSGYLKANLWHNLLGSDVRLNTAGVDLGKFEPKKTWVDAGLGTTLTVAKNTELFFDADVEIGVDRKTTAGTGKAGLRINW